MALCSDGTLAAWGSNDSGRLGNNGNPLYPSKVPVAVNTAGTLAGKTVVAIAAGLGHSLALCSDGTLAAWGSNSAGQLGNAATTNSSVPVAVDRSGLLADKTVVAIAAGTYHSLALCADGTLAAWGRNDSGELGTNTTIRSSVPVAVTRNGVLSGKTIAAVAAGAYHNLVLCTDGTVAAWGSNGFGQLGNNTAQPSMVPVAIDRSGVLAGRTVTAVAAGNSHSLALCADGTLTSWGDNTSGRLGNNSKTRSAVPVLVKSDSLRPGERFEVATSASGASHTVALAAAPPPPAATTLVATGISAASATLNGSVNAASADTAVSFEYGLTNSYGATVAAVPATVSGTVATAVSKAISGLTAGATYHYRVVASNPNGTTKGADMTFIAGSNNANLVDLSLSAGTLAPGFDKLTTSYIGSVPFATDSVTVTPTTEHPAASVKVNGVPVASGAASGVIPLAVGNTTIATLVTAEDAITTKSYTIIVTRLPESFVFNSASDVPVTANGFAAGGNPATVTLNYAPTPGTVLTMVNHTGLGFIQGVFSNLAQGQRVGLTFNGMIYDFVVNYYGGSGNDLVLQWADTQVVGWGGNGYGQLGDTTTTGRLVPTPVDATGVLAGKTITAVAEGYLHSLALCSDGTLAAWGYNVYGQLGNHSAVPSSVPVAVEQTGVLAGRTVIAIAAGPFHNLALCTDGSVVTWGYNNFGQLGTGDNSTVSSKVPVAIGGFGELAGKSVVAVRAGGTHSLALCADGTLAAWGWNKYGQLGVPGITQSPIAVATGNTVARIAIGGSHSLALEADGRVFAWGDNASGQLGNNSLTPSAVPVVVDLSGLAAGARCMMLTSGSAAQHNLAVFGLPAGGTTPHPPRVPSLAVIGSGRDAAADLIAYAFGLDLAGEGIGALPQGKRVGDSYVIEFTQPAGVTGITYGAEWSRTLVPGSWTEVPDSGTADKHIFSLSVGGEGKLFMRLRVTGQ